jgi:hypothetical protein
MQRESMTIVTLWRGGLSRPCHNGKEIEAAIADGFVPYDPREHEYPRMMYSGNLSVKVSSAAEEKERLGEGWRRTPGEDYIPEGTSGDGKTAAVPVQPASDLSALLSLIAEHDARIKSLEDHAAKDKRKKPEKPEE